ncbi:MAG: SDR family oxidoreductase [Bacteroidales bacterium]
MGKIVIIGASSEIGVAIVEKMSLFNRPMVLQYNSNSEPLERWSSNSQIVKCNFSSEPELDSFIETLKEVDILIFAAGRTDSALLPELSNSTIDEMIAVNIVAFTKICRAIIPSMARRRVGTIIGISSVAAKKVYRGQSLYAGTKAYMEAMVKGIASEWGKKGIRANCVAPGSIDAGVLKRMHHISPQELLKVNANNRMGSPKDVAEAVYFLSSSASSFINGATLAVDGAHQMGV